MPPLVSIVGKSKSGKTMLLERLIPELTRRGYRVATLKHTAHGFDMDREGKDSYRLAQAGSEVVAIASPTEMAVLYRHTDALGLEALPRFIVADHDLLLVEGFSRQKATKIEVHRPELGDDLICPVTELWAVVSDAPLDLPVPRFSWGEVASLADLIARTFPPPAEDTLELFINGRRVVTNPFVTQIMGRVLNAMVSTLKGVGEVDQIDLRWQRRG